MHDAVDPALLGRLLDEHGAALVLFAAQWTDSAEDCLQEALIELAGLATVPRNPPAWLYRVVRNRAFDRARAARRRRRHEELAASLAPAWSSPADEPPFGADELARALASLDDELREVVVARLWGGLAYEQIAEVVGVSTSTAHRRYENGLTELRRLLGAQTLDPARVADRSARKLP